MSRSLVLGLGNPILGDDSIGFRLAELLSERLHASADTDFLPTSLAGIRLLDEIPGYDRLVVIDSISTGRNAPGTLTRMGMDDLPTCSANRLSIHHIPFNEIIELGRSAGLHMPDEVRIYAIEIEYPLEAGEELTPALAVRVDDYLNEIIDNEFADAAT
jgi:hydrogenase maturation protease